MAIYFTNSIFLIPFFFLFIPFVFSLSTVSISETSNQTLICAFTRSFNQRQYPSLNCTSFPSGIQIPINPSTSFSRVVAGDGFLCALTPPSSVSIMLCWRFSTNGANMTTKRIYNGPAIKELDAGNSHICGVKENNSLECWQWREFNTSWVGKISGVAVGENFVCGLSESGRISCFDDGVGNSSSIGVIANVPNGNYSLVAAGFRHACAISSEANLDCWGETVGEKPHGQFSSLALGERRSCGLRLNGSVVCWGENNFSLPESFRDQYFTAIEAKGKVFCGIMTSNFSLFCWGNENLNSTFMVFDEVLPGPCENQSECKYGPMPGSDKFCNQGSIICQPCPNMYTPNPSPPPGPLPGNRPSSNKLESKLVAFLVVGCIGCSAFLLVICFFLFRYFKGKGCRIHDSGRLDENMESNLSQRAAQPAALPVLEKRLSHLISSTTGCHLEEFSLQQLLQVTNNFSGDHKIGTGGFGSVYHATMDDGREVAIKRAENSISSTRATITKRQQENDSAFINELESLSRLHHKNLVRLLGFCEDNNELVLVYEYMNNGTLHDHIHRVQTSPLKTSWAARLKVALDAARGIEYLHVYAIPPIIHRDIKSSNILLDKTWTAKVSDFGLSLIGPRDDESHLSLMAAGTVGYIDPEYYRLHQLTTKSDVYSFGVVLLELLTGYRAINKNENGVPRNIVDLVVPYIVQDEIHRVLDKKVPTPTPYEIEAVAYVGYLAGDCVNLEARNRPTMSDVVNSLERALAACLAFPHVSRSTSASSTA